MTTGIYRISVTTCSVFILLGISVPLIEYITHETLNASEYELKYLSPGYSFHFIVGWGNYKSTVN